MQFNTTIDRLLFAYVLGKIVGSEDYRLVQQDGELQDVMVILEDYEFSTRGRHARVAGTYSSTVEIETLINSMVHPEYYKVMYSTTYNYIIHTYIQRINNKTQSKLLHI